MGNKILPDGSNKATVDDRVSKGNGIIRDIIHVLEGTYFGDHYIEAFKVMRNCMIYSVLTYNLEVLYNLSKKDIKTLDKIDMNLIRQTMKTSSKVNRSLIFLELGFMTTEYIIKQKSLNYLQNLLQMDETAIAKQVLILQAKSPLAGDWAKTVLEDMSELDIKYNFEDISKFSKVKWKRIVKEASQRACFASLLKEKNLLGKGK